MGIVGAIIHNVVGRVDPVARTALASRWEGGHGDPGLTVLSQYVRSGMTVVDAGASYGLYLYKLSRLVGETGRVHAFEPNPGEQSALNAIAARRGNVTVHPSALSDRSTKSRLLIPSGSDGTLPSRARLDPRGTIPVEVCTLDEVLGGTSVSFLKCDVEGHELAVLRGARTILSSSHPVLLVEIEAQHGQDVGEVVDYLGGFGYTCKALGPSGQLIPYERLNAGPAYRASRPIHVTDYLFELPGGRRHCGDSPSTQTRSITT